VRNFQEQSPIVPPISDREAEEDWGSPHWIKGRKAAAARREG